MSPSERLEAIYASLPRIECKGLCYEACGPIPLTEFELQRLEKETHRKLKARADMSCNMLKNKRCLGYEKRPLICRLFGLVEKMRCPHQCEPDRWLSNEEAFEMFDEARRISFEAVGK